MRLRTLEDHVRKRRMDLGLTLNALAARLGINEVTLGDWEKGRRKPSTRLLPRIFEFLGYCPLGSARTLGDRLRQAREAAGLSRRELGRRLGLDEGTVARLERGSAKRPNRRTLIALDSVLRR